MEIERKTRSGNVYGTFVIKVESDNNNNDDEDKDEMEVVESKIEVQNENVKDKVESDFKMENGIENEPHPQNQMEKKEIIKILISGGEIFSNDRGAKGITNSTEIIYPSCTRPPMKGPDMKVARKWHVQVKMSNGDIFVCGGKNDEDEYLDSCEILSAASNEFRLLNCKMNVGRIACGGVVMKNGKIVIIGGCTKNSPVTSSCEIFDPATETFTLLLEVLKQPISLVTACLLKDDTIFVFGKNVSHFFCYQELSPVGLAFVDDGDIPNNFQPTGAVVVGDFILLAGNPFSATKCTLLFDTLTRKFSNGPDLQKSRSYVYLTDCGNRQVFIGGLSVDYSQYISYIESFNANSNNDYSFNHCSSTNENRSAPASSSFY